MTYDNLTDQELLRHVDGMTGLTKVLAERLEMRLRDIEELEHALGKRLPKDDNNPAQMRLF
jgi:hypothetical protein